jgi:DNA modification methylase
MVSSGTTLVECKLLQRNAIGVDINPDAVMIARNRLYYPRSPLDEEYHEPYITTYTGDPRALHQIPDISIDLIATHPPYAHIIPYTNEIVEGDLSSVHSINEFAEEMRQVAVESIRVLKPGKHCAILMGDACKHAHFIPNTPRVLQAFHDVGLVLRENSIKLQ